MAYENLNAGSFALTLLDFGQYKDMMLNDELAIDKVSGRLYYKNKEGQYFSVDTNTRNNQFINMLRRDFRERGNLSSYYIHKFDIPIVKNSGNILRFNNVIDPLIISGYDFSNASIGIYIDIESSIDVNTLTSRSSYTHDTEYEVSLFTNEENQTKFKTTSGKFIHLKDIIEVSDDDTLTINGIVTDNTTTDTYVLGVYVVVSIDYIHEPIEIPSTGWTWDGSWRMDGSKEFYE